AVGVGAASVMAQGSLDELREKYTTPTHIQLKPFMAPVRNGGTKPITVFLESFDKDWVGIICRQNPRIREVIFSSLHNAPLRGGDAELRDLAARLVAPVNRALARYLVKSIYIVEGAKGMSSGAVSRLPFNASGCKGVKNLDSPR
ncbi:MAG: hypothetical protein RIB59_01565, partial [Rhodospirillales bacterium]